MLREKREDEAIGLTQGTYRKSLLARKNLEVLADLTILFGLSRFLLLGHLS